ncbi:MAG: DNA-binding protein WhiA [Oscillospiraceae bacterium]|nr:DNA-binding protein WhiA [Oscillospiraceae bacterium]
MITFSQQVKQELCAVIADRPCCRRALLYGILLFGHTFSRNEVKIVTKYDCIVSIFQETTQELLGFSFEQKVMGDGKTVLSLRDKTHLYALFDLYDYGHSMSIALHINNALLEDECCRSTFLRGAFLSAGAVNAPMTDELRTTTEKFHLEISGSHYYVMREFLALLREMALDPRLTRRKSGYVIYFKAAEAIGDVLLLAGAQSAYMTVVMAQMERQLRNDVNRKVNCETGNLTRIVEAATQHRIATQKLMDSGAFAALSEDLQKTAMLRVENPEWSLSELAEALSISKSALNHRLRKIVQLSKE